MTPRAARPIPTAQPVNVTVAVSTTPATPVAPVVPAARPAGNGLAVAAVQAIGAIGQAIANSRRPRPAPVAQPVGGAMVGGVVGVPVVAAPLMSVAVAMPVAVAPVVPVGMPMPTGFAPQPQQPFPSPSFSTNQHVPTAPRMPHAPADTGHDHGQRGGADWEPAGEHHTPHTPHTPEHHDRPDPATDGHHNPVHGSAPTDSADCGGAMEHMQPDVNDGREPAVEDIQPDECESTVEDAQPDEPGCEPIIDECEPTTEDVQPEWDECDTPADECELPVDEGEPVLDDCDGVMEEEFTPEFDECGGAMPDDGELTPAGGDDLGGGEFDCGADMSGGMDAGFDMSGGADWGGAGGDYC